MKRYRHLTVALSVFLGGCAGCNERELFELLAYHDGIDANWKPGEFDMVDRLRAFRRKVREETAKTRDYSAACKAINAYMEGDRIRGFH